MSNVSQLSRFINELLGRSARTKSSRSRRRSVAFERFESRSLLAVNAPPVLSGISDLISYSENQVPAIIASTATVQDADSPNFDTGKLMC